MRRNKGIPKRNILLIEDSHSMTALIHAILEERYHVTSFHDVPEAWDWLKGGNSLDLIIVDYRLPVIDGFELVKYLSADRLYRNIPTLIITGIRPGDLPDELRLQDSHKIVHKPFDPIKLQETVFEIINQNQVNA